jgi:hypothetical protein
MERPALGENHSAFYNVLQLSDVARPVVVFEALHFAP